MKLLTYGNVKLLKGEAFGYLSAVLHLAPSWLSGWNVCPMASTGCAFACLFTAGRGVYQKTRDARLRKTRQFFTARSEFMAQLVKDIAAVERRATRIGMFPVIRLNGTSDIRWEYVPCVVDGVEYPNVMMAFPMVQFYDYSKLPNRRDLPENYHVTFSRSESNVEHVAAAMAAGFNVAVVFAKLPKRYMGRKVIDGTKTDLRFLDPKKVIVGLTPRGRARKEMSGFVVR